MSLPTDILMITHARPEYTRLSLARLLDTADEHTRIWIWHNGNHEPTLSVVRDLSSHSRVHSFVHSPENKPLREPTNWFWQNASGHLLGKIDDDCLMPPGWIETLRAAHAEVPKLGALACWHYLEEDVVPELAARKLRRFGKHSVMVNCWVGGSGYLMKRTCIEQCGLIPRRSSFTHYCITLAQHGWINGWHFPLVLQEHMDDPRSPHTLLKTDADLRRSTPLSARTFGAGSLQEWIDALKADARAVQAASPTPEHHRRWKRRFRRARRAIGL